MSERELPIPWRLNLALAVLTLAALLVLLRLAGQERFHLTLYSREIVPRTFRRFDACPEFAAMGRVLRGYRPAGPGAPCMPAPAPGARGAEPGARG